MSALLWFRSYDLKIEGSKDEVLRPKVIAFTPRKFLQQTSVTEANFSMFLTEISWISMVKPNDGVGAQTIGTKFPEFIKNFHNTFFLAQTTSANRVVD